MFGDGKTFYVFLNTTVKGTSAFFMPGNVWVDQEVILFKPKYVGTYKEEAVLELTNPLLPIRAVPEVRDKLDWKLSDDDYGKLSQGAYSNLDSCGANKHLLRTYR
jgi:hypothetical protein